MKSWQHSTLTHGNKWCAKLFNVGEEYVFEAAGMASRIFIGSSDKRNNYEDRHRLHKTGSAFPSMAVVFATWQGCMLFNPLAMSGRHGIV